MAHPFGGGGRMPLRKVVELFLAMGCDYREHELRIGEAVWTTRYIENSQTGRYVPLADYDDDELIHDLVIQSWEAILDCVIPRPGEIH